MRHVLPFLALMACDRGGLALEVPSVVVPSQLQFEDAVYGEPNYLEAPIANRGTAPADVRLSVRAPFSVPAESVAVPPGETVSALVVFTPDSYHGASARLRLSSGTESAGIPVSGTVDPDDDDDGALALGADGDDCDDQDPNTFPGADELCDGVDNDCDGETDEGC